MSTPSVLDPQRQQQAKEYACLSRRLMLVELLIASLYFLLWLVLGWSKALKTSLLQITANEWALVAMFVAVFSLIYILITLPLTYINGYYLPHRFNLSTQRLGEWIKDQIKMLLVGGPIGLLLIEVIYLVLRLTPETWWLWAVGFLLVFNVLLANLAPVLLFPIFYKFDPLGEEYADLEMRLKRLAEKAGAHVRGVYQFDMSRRTRAANAALVGMGNTRRIILGDTLLKEFTPDEIETVLAHELAHHVHKDLLLGIGVQSIITLLGFYLASVGMSRGVVALGFEGVADIAALPLFALVLFAYGLITMPLTNAFSRWRERRADLYALRATGKGEAFASAMTRLANQNLADADPEPWVEFLLHSHPALRKRIALAQELRNE